MYERSIWLTDGSKTLDASLPKQRVDGYARLNTAKTTRPEGLDDACLKSLFMPQVTDELATHLASLLDQRIVELLKATHTRPDPRCVVSAALECGVGE